MEDEKKVSNPQKKHYHRHRYHNKGAAKGDNQNSKNNESNADNKNDIKVEAPPENKNTADSQSVAPQQKSSNYQKNKHRNHHNKNRKKNESREALPEETITATDELIAKTSDDDIYEPVEEELFDDIEIAQSPAVPENKKSSVMVEVVGIRFKSTGKTYYFSPGGISAEKGSYAIVETARGLEYGEVSLSNTQVSESDIVPPLRPIVRIATEADKAHNLENKQKEKDAFALCNERIIAHGLDMKLIDAQYTFDNSKLLFYFTSAGRVDFRELVKDLASLFRTRIELRQIGIRDEAKLIGGLGLCGRPLCCSLFLSDFGQVSIKMAKEQNLSLNSSKISGICGRLMCCLRYEHETYEYEIKRTPPVDSTVKTEDGIGTVTEINPLAGTIKVRLTDKPDTPPKSYHRDNVKVISKK